MNKRTHSISFWKKSDFHYVQGVSKITSRKFAFDMSVEYILRKWIIEFETQIDSEQKEMKEKSVLKNKYYLR